MAGLYEYDDSDETDLELSDNSSDDEDYVSEDPFIQNDSSEASDAEYIEEEQQQQALGDESAAVNSNFLLMSKNKEIQYCVDPLPPLPTEKDQPFDAIMDAKGSEY